MPVAADLTTNFGPLQVTYNEEVLAPRQWTLAQSRWAADLLHTTVAGPILELCAGAGHIGLATICLTGRSGVLVDLNPAATKYARHNAAAAGLSDIVEVRTGEFATTIAPEERFAAIIADPPWVPTDQVPTFPADPPLAIDGGPDGLVVARACVRVANMCLMSGGVMLLQLGSPEQVQQLQAWLNTDPTITLVVATWREIPGPNTGVIVQLQHLSDRLQEVEA